MTSPGSHRLAMDLGPMRQLGGDLIVLDRETN